MRKQKPNVRYLLPLILMGFSAAMLLWSESLQRASAERYHQSPQTTLPFTIVVYLNFPVALLRRFWFYRVPTPWDEWLMIPAIGALWYGVARNVEKWRRVGRWPAPQRLWVLWALDSLLVTLGVVIGMVAFSEQSRAGFLSYRLIEGILGFMWCASLVLVFGSDLISSLAAIAGDKSPYRK